MAKNDSVIEILDSPDKSSYSKRKCGEFDTEYGDYAAGPVPKHPLLDSITGRFQQNSAEREMRNALLQSKRDIEKVHSDYLKQNVACPRELARAGYAASHWAKKNGIKDTTLRPAQMNLHGQTGWKSLTNSQMSKQGTSQISHTSSKNSPLRTSTVTSASLTTGSGTSEKENKSSASAEDNISVNSLRNKDGELFSSHKSASTSDAQYICPILYCEAEFSSEGSLGQHMNLFQHSPCNPCRHARDSKLLPDPLFYKCPECDLQFNTKDMCSEHMNMENHLTFYPPLKISAYLCPQCLYLFETLGTCWNHMEKSKHHRIRFPFKDDDIDSDFNLPVAMAEEFVQDYIRKCKKIAFQVQCLDCGMDILTPADFRDHQNETNNFHMMSALADTILADVFSTYIKTFSCDTCHRLFDEKPVTDSRHICAGGIVGNIKADLVRTTSEFVKCSALSLIASLKGKHSRNGTRTVGKDCHSKKSDPSGILKIDQNEPEKSNTAGDSVKRESTDLKSVQNTLSAVYFLKEEPGTNFGRVAGETVRSDIEITVEDSDSDNDCMEVIDCELTFDSILLSDSDSVMVVESQSNSKNDPVKRRKRGHSRNRSLKRLTTDFAKTAEDVEIFDIEETAKEENTHQKRQLGRQSKTAANDHLDEKKNAVLTITETETSKKKALITDCKVHESSRQVRYCPADLAVKDQNESLISTEHLKKMKNIVFLDLNDFQWFFRALPQCPTEHTFVWAFYGGNTTIRKNMLTDTFYEMRRKGLVYISEQCGTTKDSADFAMVLTVGKMDVRLPDSVTFTILSAGRRFSVVERQMEESQRSALVINPLMGRGVLLTVLKCIALEMRFEDVTQR
ncbi:E3 SUMO-protein ligase ZNF451-like isoform X2 [Mercenaria mercenaria]|nr:E3 SUMO-protein ligase ZNF451-like isoform X2 [Mercenaria mercenaria]XP_053394988.1 E3 SUMO-protein ligase ZNF451-like isoform X2 [Mercenaria mercenaria]